MEAIEMYSLTVFPLLEVIPLKSAVVLKSAQQSTPNEKEQNETSSSGRNASVCCILTRMGLWLWVSLFGEL